MLGDDLADRFLAFAARALHVVSTLPSSTSSTMGKHLARQLTSSATSWGANYAKTARARARTVDS